MVQCMPSIQKALGSDPSTLHKPGMVDVSAFLALRRWKQEGQKFEVFLIYIASLRAACAMYK